MEDVELIERLRKLTESGIKVRDIEQAVGFPKNNLSAILNGKKPLPKKRKQNLLHALFTFEDVVQLKSMTADDWQRQFKILTDDDLLKIWTDYLQKGDPFLTIMEDGRMKVIDPFGQEGIKYWREAIKKWEVDQKSNTKPPEPPKTDENKKDKETNTEENGVQDKPKNYDHYMIEAKSLEDEQAKQKFRDSIATSKLTPGQKAMVLSKIPKT